jgi:Putative metallopeptidase
MKPAAFLKALACALALGTGISALFAQVPNKVPAPADRVVIAYVEPADKFHRPLYDALKQHQALEKMRDVLARIRWPRTLRLELKGCNGDSNAWYEDATITVCYEYLSDMWRAANSHRRTAYISREDAFMGPLVDTFLHESGHAMFDLLKVPLLGREEDAADQVAAYLVLQLPKEMKKKLILGGAYSYTSELKVRSARDLKRPRLGFGRHITNADEHGTPAQRLYNLLCIAYGADKELFADVVKQGFLPAQRAEMCEDEYRQIDFAMRQLIGPHIDGGLQALVPGRKTEAASNAATPPPAAPEGAPKAHARKGKVRSDIAPVQAPAPRQRP